MLDICLLGTGGMMPLPKRWLTSLMIRYEVGIVPEDVIKVYRLDAAYFE